MARITIETPIERLWQPLGCHSLPAFIPKRPDELAGNLEESIKHLLSTPSTFPTVARTDSWKRRGVLSKGLA
jgi:hypothetical protein